MKFRLLKFRELVNPTILNDEDMVGFQGDSAYVKCDGKVIFGSWIFCDAFNDGTPVKDTDWTLDSEIEEPTLWDNIQYYHVVNKSYAQKYLF